MDYFSSSGSRNQTTISERQRINRYGEQGYVCSSLMSDSINDESTSRILEDTTSLSKANQPARKPTANKSHKITGPHHVLGKVLGPTADESILVGLQALMDMAGSIDFSRPTTPRCPSGCPSSITCQNICPSTLTSPISTTSPAIQSDEYHHQEICIDRPDPTYGSCKAMYPFQIITEEDPAENRHKCQESQTRVLPASMVCYDPGREPCITSANMLPCPRMTYSSHKDFACSAEDSHTCLPRCTKRPSRPPLRGRPIRKITPPRRHFDSCRRCDSCRRTSRDRRHAASEYRSQRDHSCPNEEAFQREQSAPSSQTPQELSQPESYRRNQASTSSATNSPSCAPNSSSPFQMSCQSSPCHSPDDQESPLSGDNVPPAPIPRKSKNLQKTTTTISTVDSEKPSHSNRTSSNLHSPQNVTEIIIKPVEHNSIACDCNLCCLPSSVSSTCANIEICKKFLVKKPEPLREAGCCSTFCQTCDCKNNRNKSCNCCIIPLSSKRADAACSAIKVNTSCQYQLSECVPLETRSTQCGRAISCRMSRSNTCLTMGDYKICQKNSYKYICEPSYDGKGELRYKICQKLSSTSFTGASPYSMSLRGDSPQSSPPCRRRSCQMSICTPLPCETMPSEFPPCREPPCEPCSCKVTGQISSSGVPPCRRPCCKCSPCEPCRGPTCGKSPCQPPPCRPLPPYETSYQPPSDSAAICGDPCKPCKPCIEIGDTNCNCTNFPIPSEVRYAITKITKFKDFATYEVMKSTSKKPKCLPRSVEGVFVLKKDECGT